MSWGQVFHLLLQRLEQMEALKQLHQHHSLIPLLKHLLVFNQELKEEMPQKLFIFICVEEK